MIGREERATPAPAYHLVVVPFRDNPRVESFATFDELMGRVEGLVETGGHKLDMLRVFAFHGAAFELVVAPAKQVRVGTVTRTVKTGAVLTGGLLGGLPCDDP